MAEFIKLPVGIENFEKIRRDGFYYVDKTGLIEQLLNNWGEVNLFTRPRRFGKTLNMSMLKCFFEIGTDQSLFEGLYISKNKALCDAYMGKYPVISISLKGVNADSVCFHAEYIVRGKTWHIVFILSRRTEIWKFVRLSDMLIVALPVWFVMGFADVYRKCKKRWMEREFS